ncbi:hypothetical protein A2867_03910 [Candidatus Daviesbacteria bacterium RIFCSPHIGHO2_01_FULL_40_11]|uniref:Uncharacterized protein n=1 Tax=Candidatus Daviesbacteria bacterium RIFCSPHIGHO2_01_FULL_40_11 TaxID=1797762 RepID=A0A1F5JGB1_9BACT|nr:MAG: hypothetical protein A2867_03910 [Candidatus Daviesbacteria bacterium RIFCSPHIGHO2_01_FULL_40_11]
MRIETFLDALRSRRAREVRAPYEPVQIDPAVGETKAALEASCQAILKKEALDSDDLNLLSKNMVELLGGTKDYLGQLISNPLTDAQRQASIEFWADVRGETFYAYVDYDDNRREQIFHVLGGIEINTTVDPNKFQYPSYFAGAETSVFSKDQEWAKHVAGDSTSAKPFFQKAFEVYQASQQPQQPAK